MRTIRKVTKKECPWLDADVPSATVVYPYNDCTYGCIGYDGIAVTLQPNQTPFFELPSNALTNE